MKIFKKLFLIANNVKISAGLAIPVVDVDQKVEENQKMVVVGADLGMMVSEMAVFSN